MADQGDGKQQENLFQLLKRNIFSSPPLPQTNISFQGNKISTRPLLPPTIKSCFVAIENMVSDSYCDFF